jgi:hypothetical protein
LYFNTSQRRVLFADNTEQSDGLEDTEQSDGLEDIAVEADSSSFDEYEQLNPEALAVLDEESERHEQRRRDALLAKEGLIGQKVTVKNANRTSEWKVIANIDSFDEVTAKQRPDDEIGMVGIDFNRLTEAEFPLVEIFLRLWPGDAEQQLTHLNAAFARKFPGKPLVSLQEFFRFVACLYAAVPAGQGGEVLWKPPQVKGILEHPNLSSVLKWARFR